MVGATATATEMQNNFGRYLNIVMGGAERDRGTDTRGLYHCPQRPGLQRQPGHGLHACRNSSQNMIRDGQAPRA